MPDLHVCRACLAYQVPVYNILKTRYQEVFERIAVLSMAECGKSSGLCAPCLETLDKFCRLKEKSAISERILTRLLQQNQLTEDAIKAVDRQKHNLADALPTFTLEPMRAKNVEKTNKKVKIHSKRPRPSILAEQSPSLSILPDSNETEANRSPNIDLSDSLPKPCDRQTLTDAMVKIGTNQTQTLEDSRDVTVKTEPSETQSLEDQRDVMVRIGLGEAQSSEGLIEDIVIKTEPKDIQESFNDVAGPEKSSFANEPNQANTISIETVTVKETPYIQIDAGQLRNIKPEVDEISETQGVQDNLVEIDIELNQPIDNEFCDDKSFEEASNSGVNVKDFIEKCKKDGRRLKMVSSECVENKKTKSQNRPSKILQCSKCDYDTPYYKRLMYHMKRHEGFVVCGVCDYKCATKSRLVSHLRVHTKERPYKCKECNKDFTELGSLSKHMNMHNGLKPYKCMWCEYEAASKNHLDRHIKRHIGDKRFKCELCDYACVQKWDLKRHAKTHENDRSRSYKRVAPVIVQVVTVTENK